MIFPNPSYLQQCVMYGERIGIYQYGLSIIVITCTFSFFFFNALVTLKGTGKIIKKWKKLEAGSMVMGLPLKEGKTYVV